MQILPTSQSDSVFGILTGSDSSSDGGFFDVMQEAINSVADGDSFNVASAAAESGQTLVESPYSRNTTDGVTYTLEEVCFTKNELAELRAQLIKEGAPEESLRQFDVLASQPDGATLAQVMASLMGNPNAGKFSEDDAHAITALLGQIDPTGTLGEDALAFMRQGNGEAALQLIQTALGKMAADERIEVDPASLVSLGRGLGLNEGTINILASSLKGRTLSLSGQQFNTLMAPARSQFVADAANAEKLQAALDKTLKPIISKARDRMEKEKEATQRESRRVQQSRILIDRTVQRNSREVMDETLAGQKTAEAGKAGGMVGKAGEDRAAAAQTKAATSQAAAGREQKLVDGNEAGLAENAKAAMNAQNSPLAESGEKGKSFGDSHDARDGSQQGNVWQDMLGKVETASAKTALNVNNASFVYSMLQGNLESQILEMDAQINRNLPQMSQQAAQQVQQGLLTAMGNGATRLDLQLHPAELGALAITLIARNGEVTAQIRSEKSETADMLNRQVEVIRVNLENQGIKIDKIEVQLQNQDDSQNTFADLGQHNARQEENARRQELTRMRNLASVLNNGANEENSALAQQLHNIGQSARYAGNALHVVA